MTHSRKPGSFRDDSLRSQLREWDPAAREQLGSVEVGAMRARLQSALRERPSQVRPLVPGALWRPLLAGVLLMVAAGVWLAVDSRNRREPPPSPETSVRAEAPIGAEPSVSEARQRSRLAEPEAAPSEDRLPDPTLLATGPKQEPREPLSDAPRPSPVQAALTGASLAEDEADAEPARRARRLALEGRRGTRIYWTLDPDFSDDFALAEGL